MGPVILFSRDTPMKATFRILAFNRAPVRVVTIDSDGLNRAAIEGYTDRCGYDDRPDNIGPMDYYYVRR